MKRLTERDKNGTAMAVCCGENCKHNFCCENGGFVECKDIDNIIDRLAAIEDILGDEYDLADVAPVRHGRWTDAESDDGGALWHCSMCSYPVKTIGGYPIYKYCPMCGALMDGKEDGHEAD